MKRLYLLRHFETGNKNDSLEIKRHIDRFSEIKKTEIFKTEYVFHSSDQGISHVKNNLTLPKNVQSQQEDQLISSKDYVSLLENMLCNMKTDFKTVLIIGHNPGIMQFYNSIKIPATDQIHFPNLALAIIDFFIESWENYDISLAYAKNIYY